MKVRLGSILEEFKAKPPADSNPEVLTLTERNGFVRQADRFSKRLATEDVSGYKYIELDDFAFNPYLLWAGAIARNDRFASGVISPLYPTFRVTPGNYAGYVERLVLSQQLISAYDNIAFGSVPRRRRSSVKDFLDLDVPALPPLDEQRRIAAILDKADELRIKRREALAYLDTLTQAIFHSMFGGDQNSKTKALSEVVSPGTIVTYGIVQAGDEYPSGVPYIRTGDLSGGVISPAKLRHTDPQIAAKFARSKVSTGDIVMSIRATVGTVALTPESLDGANLTQGTARIAPGPELTGAYLLEYLRGPDPQRWIWRHVKGATFKEITLQKLRQLPVTIPPLELQQSFATRVASVERLKELHRKHLVELDALFASLQHRAFKGEL